MFNLTDCLAKLPETPEAIRLFLADEACQGDIGMGCGRCPLSEYLLKQEGVARVEVGWKLLFGGWTVGVWFRDSGYAEATLPPAARKFIKNFDRHYYPELVREDTGQSDSFA